MPALRDWRLGAHRTHTSLCVLDSAHVREQYALEAGANSTHRLMRPLLLLDFDHANKVRYHKRATQIIEIMHVKRRILCGELDVVINTRVSDKLEQCRPSRQHVRPKRRLASQQ